MKTKPAEQRTQDMAKLRVTIKVLERQDRDVELETARFFLREMRESGQRLHELIDPLLSRQARSGTK